jgi:dTDP-4-amino-4,6-dideoxygalactose transaminase
MIAYGRQSISRSDVNSVKKALKSEYLTTGPLVEKFESALESYTGTPAVVVSSGTAALHATYAAIGISSGDEVITPPITFIATQATAALLGAKIVFADIDYETGCIDVDSVRKKITSRTKAIVAVDYAGHPAELTALKAIAKKHNVYLIEDAAHSIGSVYRGMKVGGIADVTTFSFFPTKNITSGEGGAILSNDATLLTNARLFARQGTRRNPKDFLISNQGQWHQEFHSFGLNYRLPDILCALGMSQLNRIDEFKAARTKLFEMYSEILSSFDNIQIPVKREYVDPMWHFYPIRVPAQSRRFVFDELRRAGIGVQVNYFPVHMQPVFQEIKEAENQLFNSEKFYSEEISLPMHLAPALRSRAYRKKLISTLHGALQD